MRADYANLVAIVRQRNESLQLADKKLSDAKASYAAASSARLLTTMGPPVPSDGPIGPGKMQIVLAASLLGALGCAGVVLLTMPLERLRGRRFSDYLPPHLRPAERNTGRRDVDRVADPAQLAILSQAFPANAVAEAPKEEEPARRGRRATDLPEPYAGPDRRTGERRRTAVEEEIAEEPEELSQPTSDSDDEGESSMVDNLRRQIDLLRESTVRFESAGKNPR
jgi:hypothetical protein